MKRSVSFDHSVAIMTIPIAILLIIVEYKTPRATIPQAIGPHVWPIGLLCLLIVSAILLFSHATSQKRKALPLADLSSTKTGVKWYRRPQMASVMMLLGLFLYTVFLRSAGFIICTSLLVIYEARVMERGRWGRNIIIGVVFSVGVYFIFVKVLNVMLPAGLLGW
jgi:putative tricarboxylic transport membrane protein